MGGQRGVSPEAASRAPYGDSYDNSYKVPSGGALPDPALDPVLQDALAHDPAARAVSSAAPSQDRLPNDPGRDPALDPALDPSSGLTDDPARTPSRLAAPIAPGGDQPSLDPGRDQATRNPSRAPGRDAGASDAPLDSASHEPGGRDSASHDPGRDSASRESPRAPAARDPEPSCSGQAGPSCTGSAVQHGVEAGAGGPSTTSLPALICGGAFVAAAFGAAAHRMWGRRGAED
ncbi:hypothetical protein ACF061_20000 [Streptomyces sp. NPDC015220]|uniref:hypothetical protein n=1 Tax=Streptomyces sp. NPDC015220 TaxID=3364947 RepID=UPI003700EC6E